MVTVFKYTNGMPTAYFKTHSSAIAGIRTDILQIGDYAIMNTYSNNNSKSGGIYGRVFRYFKDKN